MAIQNEPSRISTPFADAGTKNVIPETMAQPSATAAASWQAGFPTVCSLPLSAGGIPPARNDFNGLLNQMTQTERFLQDGGIFAWDASTDYGANRLVLGSNGRLYWSIAQSGPNVGGAKNPTSDDGTYWQAPFTKTMPLLDNTDAIATTNWVKKTLNAQLYVDASSGNDANDGLTQAKAVKTIARAISIFGTLPASRTSYDLTINIAGGTYTESFDIGETMCNVVLGGNITVNGITLNSNSVLVCGNDSYSITVNGNCIIRDGSILKIACGLNIQNGYLDLRNGASAQCVDVTVSAPGNSSQCVLVRYASDLLVSGTITASNSDSDAIVFCTHASSIEVAGAASFAATNISALIVLTNGAWVGFRGGVSCSGTGNSCVVSCSQARGLIYGGLSIPSGVTNACINLDNGSSFGLSGNSDITSASSGISLVNSSTLVVNGSLAITSGGGDILSLNYSSNVYISEYVSLSLTASSTCNTAIISRQCSSVIISGHASVSFSGSFSLAVVLVNSNGSLDIVSSCTLSGSPTGTRYSCSTGGQILTHGGGGNRIPGSTAGDPGNATYGCYS